VVLVAGTVRCWGRNDFRQLGDGTTQTSRSPLPVPGVPVGTAVGVVAGRTYTCILTVRGNVQCWGANSRGELGDGTFVDRPSPVLVRRQLLSGTLTLGGVVALVGGNTHACVVAATGQPMCWGNNENGQLGDTTTFNRVAAVGVPSFTANIDPAADVSHHGRRAEVTALVSCPDGARFRVRLELQQDGAEGHGQEEGKCDGGLARVPVKVSAQGRRRFDEGAADARAVIDVRLKGDLVDHQEWSRVVTLTSP
jgi:hypothetical protein